MATRMLRGYNNGGQNGRNGHNGSTTGSMPWVEKYRPASLEDVVGHKVTVQCLRTWVERHGALQSCIFHGPPGVGKTSMALAAIRMLYGDAQWRSWVKVLNASMDRGIQRIRELEPFLRRKMGRATVKAVERYWNDKHTTGSTKEEKEENKERYKEEETVTKERGGDEGHGHGREGTTTKRVHEETASSSCPRMLLRYVVLDEADSLTPDAQAALRSMMELYHKHVRFIFLCNYVGDIDPAIVSRCVQFHCLPIPDADITRRLSSIAQTEHVAVESRVVRAMARLALGDMRLAIQWLQRFQHGVTLAEFYTATGSLSEEKKKALAEAIGAQPLFAALQHARETRLSTAAIIECLHEHCMHTVRQHATHAPSSSSSSSPPVTPQQLRHTMAFLQTISKARQGVSFGVEGPIQLTSVVAAFQQWYRSMKVGHHEQN